MGRNGFIKCLYLFSVGGYFHGDGFYFCVVVECVLAQLPADARLLEAAKRGLRVEHVVTVNPHRARAQILSQVHSVSDVLKEKNIYKIYVDGALK